MTIGKVSPQNGQVISYSVVLIVFDLLKFILKRTSFFKSTLREVDFSQADLAECSFKECDLLKSRFSETNLIKADFRGAFSYIIDPVGNKVRGARFSLPEAQGLLAGLGITIE